MVKTKDCLGCGDLSEPGKLFCASCRAVLTSGLAKRIFVFTPDPNITAEAQEHFGPLGCSVQWEKKLDDAELMIRKDIPDLVVIDVESSGSVGMELVRDLKAASPPIPTIVISNSKLGKNIFLNIGADAFLVKPMDKEEFIKTIAQLLRKD